jgi:tRNA1(Val) A37 N6-methylase TrmN6
MKKAMTPTSEVSQTKVTITPVVLEQIKKISEELKKQQAIAQQIGFNLELVIVTVLSQSGYDLSKVTNLSINDETSELQFELKGE